MRNDSPCCIGGMPFGIWGVAAFLIFLVVALRVLYLNYKHGDPALKNLNTFLLAVFAARTLFFFFVFGAIQLDMAIFAGLIGFSVSVNGGVRRTPFPEDAPAVEPASA